MNRQTHLTIDAVGQLSLLAAFVYLLATTPGKDWAANWRFFALFTVLWQFVQALVSTRIYLDGLRTGYLRILGWSLLWLVLPLGVLYIGLFAFISTTLSLPDWLGYAVQVLLLTTQWLLPALFSGLIIWYYYLTAKDIHITLFKTV